MSNHLTREVNNVKRHFQVNKNTQEILVNDSLFATVTHMMIFRVVLFISICLSLANGSDFVVGGKVMDIFFLTNYLMKLGYFPNWSPTLACHSLPVSAFDPSPYTHVWYVFLCDTKIYIVFIILIIIKVCFWNSGYQYMGTKCRWGWEPWWYPLWLSSSETKLF